MFTFDIETNDTSLNESITVEATKNGYTPDMFGFLQIIRENTEDFSKLSMATCMCDIDELNKLKAVSEGKMTVEQFDEGVKSMAISFYETVKKIFMNAWAKAMEIFDKLEAHILSWFKSEKGMYEKYKEVIKDFKGTITYPSGYNYTIKVTDLSKVIKDLRDFAMATSFNPSSTSVSAEEVQKLKEESTLELYKLAANGDASAKDGVTVLAYWKKTLRDGKAEPSDLTIGVGELSEISKVMADAHITLNDFKMIRASINNMFKESINTVKQFQNEYMKTVSSKKSEEKGSDPILNEHKLKLDLLGTGKNIAMSVAGAFNTALTERARTYKSIIVKVVSHKYEKPETSQTGLVPVAQSNSTNIFESYFKKF